MDLQLDHFFILTERLAPVGVRLTELGFLEGSSNRHPGQGTANRRFFFANTTLELLYVSDRCEAEHGVAGRFQFPKRTESDAASPFGFVFRMSGADPESAELASWQYHAEYLPPQTHFLVAENSADIREPLIVCMPPELSGAKAAQPTNHLSLSQLKLTVTNDEYSEALRTVGALDIFDIGTDKQHFLELEFDSGVQGEYHDLRPELPLAFRY
jgi:hypothetical protein